MTLRILDDSKKQPLAFHWFGPIDARDLSQWCRARRIRLPSDLFDFLVGTGGGDIFDSETILGPCAGHATADDSDSANAWHRARGLVEEMWLFHVGLTLSAIRGIDSKYVSLSNDYIIEAEYNTLDEWYSPIRSEFAERYDLGK